MKKVTKDTFYATVGDVDAVVLIVPGDYPYTAEFKLRNSGRVIGKAVDRISELPDEYTVTDYYIA